LRDNSTLKLTDAQELFKEIIDKCPSLNKKNFLIILPEAAPQNISEGYEVTIRADAKAIDKDTLNTLHEIAAKKKLQMMEASESIMFYESSERAKKLKKALEELKRSTEFERKP
jgi:16S rRNA G1207 methylase RsmC